MLEKAEGRRQKAAGGLRQIVGKAMPERNEASARRAVVLLSGGLDSYTAAAFARAEGFALFALTVHYGQRHACELDAARRVARALGVARHLECEVDLAALGGSALTGNRVKDFHGRARGKGNS